VLTKAATILAAAILINGHLDRRHDARMMDRAAKSEMIKEVLKTLPTHPNYSE
jgi:hypothetical protein